MAVGGRNKKLGVGSWETGVRSQNKNGDEIAKFVLLVEFVELVLLVNLMPTVLKEK